MFKVLSVSCFYLVAQVVKSSSDVIYNFGASVAKLSRDPIIELFRCYRCNFSSPCSVSCQIILCIS